MKASEESECLIQLEMRERSEESIRVLKFLHYNRFPIVGGTAGSDFRLSLMKKSSATHVASYRL